MSAANASGTPGDAEMPSVARPGARFGEEAVGMAVIATFEFDDQIALGEPAGQANGGHGGFRSGVDEANHFDGGNCFRDFLA